MGLPANKGERKERGPSCHPGSFYLTLRREGKRRVEAPSLFLLSALPLPGGKEGLLLAVACGFGGKEGRREREEKGCGPIVAALALDTLVAEREKKKGGGERRPNPREGRIPSGGQKGGNERGGGGRAPSVFLIRNL